MNILITGANGFLGKFIWKEFISNSSISTLSRRHSNYTLALENQIPEFKVQFDIVIHAAGKAHSIPKTELEKKQFEDINYIGTRNLLTGLERSGLPKQFVFISSVAVYGKEIGVDINEEQSLEAKDPYGVSKIRAEQIIKDWCQSHNIVCTVLRLPLLVGKNPPGNLGQMVKAIDRGYYFNIAKGKAKKSMVLASDVASFIRVAAPVGGIYNLTDGFHPSFAELSKEISKDKKKQFSLPIYLAKIIGKIGDLLGDKAPIDSLKVKKITSDLTFDDSKARKLLQWKPKQVLDYLKQESLQD